MNYYSQCSWHRNTRLQYFSNNINIILFFFFFNSIHSSFVLHIRKCNSCFFFQQRQYTYNIITHEQEIGLNNFSF